MVFLSHAGEDKLSACFLAKSLKRAGVDVWLDVEKIKPGSNWIGELEGALQRSSAFILYVGKSPVQKWVDRELRSALDRSASDADFSIFPVLGPGADDACLPLFIRQHQWLDMREGLENEEILANLIAALKTRKLNDTSLRTEDRAPFRGLLPFETDDALFYFGRDKEVQELVRQLQRNRFQLVVGASGSGKSSLVLAGLIPALHRGRFQSETNEAEDWRVTVLRPGKQPLEELADALVELAPEKPAHERLQFCMTAREALTKERDGIRYCVTSLVPIGFRTLLVVDQFEELFTLCSDEMIRHRFVDLLLAASEPITARAIHVLVTLRADFYARCWEHEGLRAKIAETQYALGRPNQQQLAEMIQKPLKLVALIPEPGLVDVIVREAGNEPGNLPLIEHALLQLWNRRQGNKLTHAAYDELGRMAGALKRHADGVIEALDTQE